MSAPAMTWTLGELMAKARKDAGLEQTEIAARVGIARNSVSNYETGRANPTFVVVARWARVCGVSLDALAEGVETTTAPAGAEAVDSLSQHSVRPKGLEPLTFWFVVAAGLMGGYLGRSGCQGAPDSETANVGGLV